MSTPGKVLVVLVTLTSLVWIVLIASVAQINNSGSEQVANLKAQIEKLESDVVTAQRNLVALRDDIDKEQVSMGLDQTTFQAKRAAMEKVRADTIEQLTRVQFLLAESEAAVKNAQVARDQREAEKKAETEGKAQAEAEVAKLTEEHGRLTEELNRLTSEFRTTLESNKRLVDRLLKSAPAARPASLVR